MYIYIQLLLLFKQIHLVSMKEVINGKVQEEKLFKSQIPKIAQAMMPLWKKRFYDPMSKCLEIE